MPPHKKKIGLPLLLV